MIVFISSVRYLLKDERDNLPPFLDVIGHRGLRFEDFAAPDASSRQACLAGVAAADVYVLLLGPKYGDPFPDTGLSPTHEEFVSARNRGIPILVFVKDTDEPDEPLQAEFKAQVGHYVNGRFWKTFKDPMSLNLAVGRSLKDLPPPGGLFRLLPVEAAPAVPWLDSSLRPRDITAPVLELHLLPTTTAGLISASALARAATTLANDARTTGFVPNHHPLQTGSTNTRAWVARPAETTRHRSASSMGWSEEAWRGAAVSSDGTASAWLSLPSDMFGTLIDQPTLHRHVTALLALASPHVSDSEQIAVAVRLAPAGKVREGDPSQVGQTSSGGMSQRDVSVVIEPMFAVHRDQLSHSSGDLAAEIVARLINDIRQIPTY